MTQKQVLKAFKDTGALLEGHFELRSKLHSNRYFQCANVLRFPRIAEKLCRAVTREAVKSGKLGKKIDGVISPAEATNTFSQMSAGGLTKLQLTQLQASGATGVTDSDYAFILENFEAIDSNGDGKVTDAEIAAYKMTTAKMEKEDEMRDKFATDMSVFYGSESSSSAGAYSILSYKYKNNKNN